LPASERVSTPNSWHKGDATTTTSTTSTTRSATSTSRPRPTGSGDKRNSKQPRLGDYTEEDDLFLGDTSFEDSVDVDAAAAAAVAAVVAAAFVEGAARRDGDNLYRDGLPGDDEE